MAKDNQQKKAAVCSSNSRSQEFQLMPFIRVIHKRDNLGLLDQMIEISGGVLQAKPSTNKMIIAPQLLPGYVSLM